MTGKRRDQNGPTRTHPPDALGELLRHAGARARPPRADENAIRTAVRHAWLQSTTAARRRRFVTWAVAASVVAAVAFSLAGRLSGPGQPGPRLATVEKSFGEVQSGAATGGADGVEAGADLHPGQPIRSGPDAGLALRWHDGTTIRIAADTSVVLTSRHELRLVRGAVYIDTGTAAARQSFAGVTTPAGRIRHVGTRYMARVDTTATTVSVRTGTVVFRPEGTADNDAVRATSSQRLSVSRSGPPRVESTSTWGPEWDWVDALVPAFRADGRSLAEFFEWVATESGRSLSYASPAARRVAKQNRLHGTIELPPLRALAVASASSDLTARVNEGEIRIALR